MKHRTTQRQVSSPWPLPACKAGHPARLMEDGRCAQAGGGIFIECRCCHTQKHPSAHVALQEWVRLYGRPSHQPAVAGSNVIQLGLLLGDRSTG